MLVIRRRRVWEAWPVRSLFKLDRQSRPLPRPLTSRVESVQAVSGIRAIPSRGAGGPHLIPVGADVCQ